MLMGQHSSLQELSTSHRIINWSCLQLSTADSHADVFQRVQRAHNDRWNAASHRGRHARLHHLLVGLQTWDNALHMGKGESSVQRLFHEFAVGWLQGCLYLFLFMKNRLVRPHTALSIVEKLVRLLVSFLNSPILVSIVQCRVSSRLASSRPMESWRLILCMYKALCRTRVLLACLLTSLSSSLLAISCSRCCKLNYSVWGSSLCVMLFWVIWIVTDSGVTQVCAHVPAPTA